MPPKTSDHVVLQRLFADLDLVARAGACLAQSLLQLRLARRRARDAIAAVGAEDAERRALRLRPVDEVLGHLGLGRLLLRQRRHEREERAAERLDALPGRAGEREHRQHAGWLEPRGLREQVDLVQHEHLGQLVEPGPVAPELGANGGVVGVELAGRGVDDMHEHPRPLEVREKLVAEACTLGGALDQPRNVRDDQLGAVRRVDRPEHGLERRERVVGDLRLRIRDPREERRLPGIREADERSVGEQLQMQLELGLLARQAGLGKPRRLERGRRKAAVAASARAPAAEDGPGARMREIGDEMPFVVEHLRADGYAQHGVVAGRAMFAGSPAGTTLARRVLALRPKRREIAEVGVGDEHDVPSGASVTSVGPTSGHVLLAPEAERAVSTTPGDRGDAGAVVEHRWLADGDGAAVAARPERDLAVAAARRSCRRGRGRRPGPA